MQHGRLLKDSLHIFNYNKFVLSISGGLCKVRTSMIIKHVLLLITPSAKSPESLSDEDHWCGSSRGAVGGQKKWIYVNHILTVGHTWHKLLAYWFWCRWWKSVSKLFLKKHFSIKLLWILTPLKSSLYVIVCQCSVFVSWKRLREMKKGGFRAKTANEKLKKDS